MKLKENIYNICKNVKSDISPDSLAALVLYSLSKEDYFKDNYNHFELIDRHGEIRLFSTPINKASGCTNGRLGYQVINSDPNDYHLDSFWNAGKSNDEIENPHVNDDEYYFSEDSDSIYDDCLVLRERKYNNIKEFFKIIEKSNSFDEVLELIGSENKYLLLDVKQNIMDTFRYQNDVKNLEPLLNIIENLMIASVTDGLYTLSNSEVSFGVTHARDYFDCNELSYMALNVKDKSYLKKSINKSSSWEIEQLFIDDVLCEIPSDVTAILENEKIENWKAVKLYSGLFPKYKSSLLRSALSTKITSEEKHVEIANYFFDKLKEQALSSKAPIFERISSNKQLLKKHSETIDIITQKIKRDYLVLNSSISPEKVELLGFGGVKSYDESEQAKYLSSLYLFDFYPEENLNKVVSGIQYGDNNSFSYSKQKENFLVTIKNENDLVGFGHFYIEDDVIRINTVNIANHHRGKKKVKSIYQKLINYAASNNLVIQTSMYSCAGESRLPRLKKELLKENKGTLWIDTCTNRFQTSVEYDLVMLGESILLILKEHPTIDVGLVRKIYDEQEFLFKSKYEDNLSWDDKDELKNNFLIEFKRNISKGEKNKINTVKNKLAS
jgi:hypothetical protein